MRHIGAIEIVQVGFLSVVTLFALTQSLRAPPNKDPWELIQKSDCRCYTFSSTKRLRGEFKSPNYPSPYPAELDCIIYLFQGLPSQIVELSFLNLDLSPPRIDICFDYVAVLPPNDTFGDTDRQFASPHHHLMGYSEAPTILCGILSMQRKTTFYSESNSLAVVFHSSERASFEKFAHMTGFRGGFLFLNASDFRIDGERIPKSDCSYVINSGVIRRPVAGGRIVSPRYPNEYPPNLRCSYTFVGRSDERVVVSIHSLLLSHRDFPNSSNTSTMGCIYDSSPTSFYDRLLVYNLTMGHLLTTASLVRICGSVSNYRLISGAPNLQLTFLSRPFRPKSAGFLIEYAFIRQNVPSTTHEWDNVTPVHFEQQAIKESISEVFEYLQNKHNNQHLGDLSASNANEINSDSANPQQHICKSPEISEITIDSQKSDEGVLTSPRFPEAYPKCVRATYYFRGKPGQRVFLKFVLLELGDFKRCEEHLGQGGDRINFYDGLSTYIPVQMNVCGSRDSVFKPESRSQQLHSAQHLTIASSGPHFTMLFISDEFVGKFEYGFRLEYHFRNLITWETPADQNVEMNNTQAPRKDRVVYFNYDLDAIHTNSKPTHPYAPFEWSLLIVTYWTVRLC